MVPRITVIGEEKYKVPKDLIVKSSELFFEYLAAWLEVDEGVTVTFTIVFVSPADSKSYNREYRNKDVPTDVLSFCTQGEIDPSDGQNGLAGRVVDVGDLIVCPDVVRQNSIRFDVSYGEELIRVVVHGILHLLGLDHEGRLGESSERIFEIQESFLQNLRKTGFIK